jgi:hypothetical protein
MALSNPTNDGVGQQCATLKVTGDNDPTEDTVYYAVRTTGPYVVGDGPDIRSGVGAVATAQQPNMTRIYALFTGLESSTEHYWGAVKATGDAVVSSFTTDTIPAEVEPPAGYYPSAGIEL